MTRRLLDLFCGAGGASAGYAEAGFDVFGVDLNPMPRYPFPFHQGDALTIMAHLLEGRTIDFDGLPYGLQDFDAIHASPPCQAYSITRHSHSIQYPELIEPVRDALIASGLPYVIENVKGAPLLDPIVLCGSMFEHVAVDDRDGTILELRRHRLFESSVTLAAPPCNHVHAVGGVYGGGSSRRSSTRTDWPKGRQGRGGYTPVLAVRKRLMRIDWMNRDELSESIPPSYTAHIGDQIMQAIS